jgi:Na+-driven multidrug efflux pump
MVLTVGCIMGVQLPLCYVLSNLTDLGVTGIWIGIPTGYAIFCVVSYMVLRKGNWLAVKI